MVKKNITRTIAVDLDGTLVNTDMLAENLFLFLRVYPLRVFAMIAWLFSGKAYFKRRLADAIIPDVANVPYNKELLDWLEQQRNEGASLVLATASDYRIAKSIADHLGIFDEVLGTKEKNLSSANKRAALVDKYGDNGFEYIGNSSADFEVWQSASEIHVANPKHGVLSAAKKIAPIKTVFENRRPVYRAVFKALRMHQWVKNLLLFVPLLASHQIDHPDLLLNGLLAFLFFGLCASSIYMLNDLLDLQDDRLHPGKRNRPFASGDLSIKTGVIVLLLLYLMAFTGSFLLLPLNFTLALAVYSVITLLYSLWIKSKILVDVITLALLYTLRVIAGTFVFEAMLTFWMLAFSTFIFLSLALVKRYAELKEADSRSETDKLRGRGYSPEDLTMISSLGAASGYLSVLILAFYIQDSNTTALYQYPQVIWLACPLLLYWISRVWLLTHRGLMHEDPVVFTLKDNTSLVVGLLFGFIFWVAT